MEDQSAQTSVQEPVSDPVPVSVSVPPFKTPVIPLLLVLLVILLSSTAFLFYQNQQLKSMLAKYQTPVVSPAPTATAEPTANWKTYIAFDKSFSFKYPNDWNTPSEGKLQTNFDNILTVASKPSITLDQFVTKNLPTDNTQPIDYVSGNIHGKKLIYKSGAEQATTDVVIVFPGQTKNVITFSYADFPGHITKSETIDQILSTFKFLDSTSINKSDVCQKAGAVWLEKYNECESPTLTAQFCKDNHGTFAECESPCRHDSQAGICQTVCMAVCKF